METGIDLDLHCRVKTINSNQIVFQFMKTKLNNFLDNVQEETRISLKAYALVLSKVNPDHDTKVISWIVQ